MNVVGLKIFNLDMFAVGGVETDIKSFPNQVALYKYDGSFRCGGSIISRNCVVTAGGQ